MAVKAFGILDSPTRVMDMLSHKQQLIASNIANMDTPGYVRKTMSFSDYLGTSASPLEAKINDKFGPVPYSTETGEAVNPAEEIADMQRNYVLYSIASKEMNSTITKLKTVINVGQA
ncbi:hypothetical protein IJC60_04660 [bacterium]|nr:hypothetical protein [bacterium]